MAIQAIRNTAAAVRSASLTELGHEAVLCILNQESQLESAARMTGYRVEEAKKASEILKARPAYVGQIDGNAVVDQSHYDPVPGNLRKENPSVVFTHWPIDNHADHRAISMLVYDAWLHMRKKFSLYLLRGLEWRGYTAVRPERLRGHFRERAEEASGLLCARHTGSRQVLRATRRSCTLARHESGHTRAEAFIRHVQSPRFAPARLIVPRINTPSG